MAVRCPSFKNEFCLDNFLLQFSDRQCFSTPQVCVLELCMRLFLCRQNCRFCCKFSTVLYQLLGAKFGKVNSNR